MKNNTCQFIEINTMAGDNFFLKNYWFFLKRILRFIKNRIRLLRNLYFKNNREKSSNGSLNSTSGLKPGDMVRIRSKKEILSTLDAWQRYQKCMFMDEMWKYCGGEYKVLKRVNYILDEKDIKLKRMRDTVLLENLICNGSWPFVECDRSCYFFWKEIWLEKIES